MAPARKGGHSVSRVRNSERRAWCGNELLCEECSYVVKAALRR